MSQEKRYESLSALMDGEAGELELHQMLKQSQDRELREQWQRWQQLRNALHGQPQSFAALDLTAKVSAALDAPAQSASPVTRRKVVLRSRLWRGAGQLAVAASVTLAVLGGVRFYQSSPSAAANLQAQTQQGTVAPFPAEDKVRRGGHLSKSIGRLSVCRFICISIINKAVCQRGLTLCCKPAPPA